MILSKANDSPPQPEWFVFLRRRAIALAFILACVPALLAASYLESGEWPRAAIAGAMFLVLYGALAIWCHKSGHVRLVVSMGMACLLAAILWIASVI